MGAFNLFGKKKNAPDKFNKYHHQLNKTAIFIIGALVVFQFLFIHIAPSEANELTAENLFTCTNSMRTDKGLTNLVMNEQLTKAAESKLADMKKYMYWAHENPSTGAKPWDFVDGSGYYYRTTGENLAFGFIDSSKVCESWKKSQAHYNNIINTSFQEVGFAVSKVYLGKQGRGLLVVQMFGSRKDFVKPAVSTQAKTQVAQNDSIQNTEEQENLSQGQVAGVTHENNTPLPPWISKNIILLVIISSYLALRFVLLSSHGGVLSVRSTMLISIFLAIASISIVYIFFYI